MQEGVAGGRPRLEGALGVEAEALACRDAACAAGALQRGGARDWQLQQRVDPSGGMVRLSGDGFGRVRDGCSAGEAGEVAVAFDFARPLSTTYTTPSMVRDVSAMFVARTACRGRLREEECRPACEASEPWQAPCECSEEPERALPSAPLARGRRRAATGAASATWPAAAARAPRWRRRRRRCRPRQ